MIKLKTTGPVEKGLLDKLIQLSPFQSVMRPSRIIRPKETPELDTRKEKEEKNLPRKSAVIRRTYPEPDVMKTELRFVSYKRPGGDLDANGFFEEVSQFLREQMEDMAKKDGSVLASTRETGDATTCHTEASSREEETFSTTHHEVACVKGEALKKAILILKRLVQYYKQTALRTNDRQYQMMQLAAEGVLKDTQTALDSGGAGQDLFERIKLLNSFQQSN